MKKQRQRSHKNKSRAGNQRSGSKREKQVIRQVETLAGPLCASENLELVHIEYQRESGGRVLRVYIDRPEGVALDDCVNVSRQLNDLLDVSKLEAGKFELIYEDTDLAGLIDDCIAEQSPEINRK